MTTTKNPHSENAATIRRQKILAGILLHHRSPPLGAFRLLHSALYSFQDPAGGRVPPPPERAPPTLPHRPS